MQVTVSRRAHFNAAHRLHNQAWTAEKNRAVFGPCNNENYHGHNYEIEVFVTGEVDPDTGYVIDLGLLKKIIKEEVEDRFDHKNLNLDVSDFQNKLPSAENIVIVLHTYLKKRLANELKLRVKLWETPRNAVVFPPV